jgi:hypothetical protein
MDNATLLRELAREREELAREREARAAADSRAEAAASRAEAADSRAEALRAQLALLRIGEAAAAQAGGGGQPTAPIPSQLSVPLRVLQSPSTKAASIIDGVFCAVVERPVAAEAQGVALRAPGVADAFRALLDAARNDPRELAPETSFYARATAVLPAFAEPVGGPAGNMEACTLFTKRCLSTRAWTFTATCKPELHVRAALSAARPFRPTFNGEVKSVGATWLEQAVYYTVMDMVRVFFPAREDGAAPGPRRFFARPPLGFAIVAFPHVGYLVALEWAGVLFVSPVSAPFFLGSAEHAAAVEALPDVRYEEPVPLEAGLSWFTAAPDPPPPCPPESVSWAVAGGTFRKLLRADARSPARFRSLFGAYERLAALAGEAGAPGAPGALAAVARGMRLSYGAHEVLVEMAALGGARDATQGEVTNEGRVLEAAAAGVAWLAARGVLYVDLRGPNVLVSGEEVWLVDFDDCLLLEAPVRSALEFRGALSCSGAAAAGDWAGQLVRDALPKVNAALERAFAALAL